MERLTLEQARARIEVQKRRLGYGDESIDWTRPGREAVNVGQFLANADDQSERDAILAVALALLGYQAYLDYEAGRAAALAGIGDAVVKPGDRIQDMEAKHRDGRHRVMRVDRIVSKDGRPYAECSHAIAGRPGTRVRLDRIHRKNIQTGWRVLDAAEGR